MQKLMPREKFNPICFAPCPSIGLEKVGNWRNWQKCGFHDDTLPMQVFGLENIYQSARAPQCLSNIDVQPIYWQLSFLDSMWIINIRVCLALPWWVRCRETKICKSWKDLKVPSAGSPFMLSAKWKGNEYHHFEQVRPKMGGNLSQSSRAFSAFEAETCNCLPANSQYVEKLQWPWNSTLYRNSSSTNYFFPLQQKNWLTK